MGFWCSFLRSFSRLYTSLQIKRNEYDWIRYLSFQSHNAAVVHLGVVCLPVVETMERWRLKKDPKKQIKFDQQVNKRDILI